MGMVATFYLRTLRSANYAWVTVDMHRITQRGQVVYTTVQPRLSRLSPAQKMYLCACVQGVAVRIQWVWPLLSESGRHACWLENARNDKQRCFHTRHIERREKSKHFSYTD